MEAIQATRLVKNSPGRESKPRGCDDYPAITGSQLTGNVCAERWRMDFHAEGKQRSVAVRALAPAIGSPLSQVPNSLATYVRSVEEWIFMLKENKDLSLFEHCRQRLGGPLPRCNPSPFPSVLPMCASIAMHPGDLACRCIGVSLICGSSRHLALRTLISWLLPPLSRRTRHTCH